jgi:hypothetical protein
LFRTLPPSAELWRALTIYQLGGVLHDLIARTPLFQEEVSTGNRYAVALAVQSKMPRFDAADVSPDLKRLALHCLAKDPKQRLALVSWEDFAGPASNDLPGLHKRLAALQQTQKRVSTVQQEELKNIMAKRDLALKIFEAAGSAIHSNFTAASFERVQVPNDPLCHVLRWHFPGGEWALDLSLQLVWPDAAPSLYPQPGLTARADLARTSSAAVFRPEGKLLGLISCGEDGEKMAAAAAFQSFSSYLDEALTILEQEGPKEASVRLGD